jgi:hypothetical protein
VLGSPSPSYYFSPESLISCTYPRRVGDYKQWLISIVIELALDPAGESTGSLLLGCSPANLLSMTLTWHDFFLIKMANPTYVLELGSNAQELPPSPSVTLCNLV